jgi:hypothetical protein
MKTLTNLLPLLLLPVLAHAENSDQKLAARLAQSSQTAQGIVVRNVSKEYVDSAVKKLGGNAILEFGANDKLALASGGVIVGSGGDSRAARVSTDSRSNLTVRAPIIPVQSITVVGRDKFQNDSPNETEACAQKIVEGDSKASTQPEDKKVCAQINKSIRLRPGKYILTYQVSIAFVTVAAGENKIIPLREIYVPKADQFFTWQIFRDHLSKLEQSKTLKYFASSKCWQKLFASEALPVSSHVDENGIFPELCDLPTYTSYLSPMYGGDFVSVLPGTYGIIWKIEGDIDYTNNIVVK